MAENPFDRIQSKLEARMDRTMAKIDTTFKNVDPFDKKKVSNDELLYIYDNLAPQDMNYLLQNYERDAINQKIYEVEQIKRRRGL